MLKLPKLKFQKARNVILVVVIATFTFGAGFYLGGGGKTSLQDAVRVRISRELPSQYADLDFSLFWKVWDTLRANYYDKGKLVDSDMVYGAIKGMVAAVGDPYTVFLPPEENKVVEEDLQGSFEGVGIQIGFKGTRLAVISPLPGSPGEAAGIHPGDLIVGIKDDKKGIDRSTAGITLPEAVEAIRGPKDSIVTLALLRDGADTPIVVDVRRDNIDVPSVVLDFVGKDKDIAHLKVSKFSSETQTEWAEAVAKVSAKGSLRGVIVDVRNDPGGYLQAAIDLASEFIKTGTTVVSEGASDGSVKQDYKVERIGKLLGKKVVVLINGGSASASEILSGALKDDLGSVLIGETSFGKGTVQEPIPLGSSNLHVTTAKWLTPSGTWVNEKGLTPDIKVENNPDTPEDEQLQEAINQFN